MSAPPVRFGSLCAVQTAPCSLLVEQVYVRITGSAVNAEGMRLGAALPFLSFLGRLRLAELTVGWFTLCDRVPDFGEAEVQEVDTVSTKTDGEQQLA